MFAFVLNPQEAPVYIDQKQREFLCYQPSKKTLRVSFSAYRSDTK